MSRAAQRAVEPACDSTLYGTTTSWQKRPAGSYPPGWYPLCSRCFPTVDRDDDGRAPDFDHADVVDHVVLTTGHASDKRLHRPRGERDG